MLDRSVSAPAAPEQIRRAPASTAGLRRRVRPGEALIQTTLFICACVSVATTFGIVLVLGREALAFFTEAGVSLGRFLTGTARGWAPRAGRRSRAWCCPAPYPASSPGPSLPSRARSARPRR